MAENSIQQVKFDYTGVDAEAKALCIERTEEIRAYLNQTTESMVEAGRRLAEVKATLKHGQFGAWLKAEFKLSERSAENLINVYGKSEIISDLGKNLPNFVPTALNMLSAPSVPKKALEAAVKRASKGERITVATAKQIKATFDIVAGTAVKVEREAEPVKRSVRDVPYKVGEAVLHVPTGLRCVVATITPEGMVKLRPTVSTPLTRSIDWSKSVALDDIAMGKAGVAAKPVMVEQPRSDERTDVIEQINECLSGAPMPMLQTVLHLLQASVAEVA